ncbi:hemoglobin [Limibacillus sp. MBR-115]
MAYSWGLGSILSLREAGMAATVFDRYGGFGFVSKVVLDFYDRVGDSEILAPYFASSDMKVLIDHQTKFIASLMGGPASYTDEVLRRVHLNLSISDEAFDEMATILEETLEDFEFDPADVHNVIHEIKKRRHVIVTN